jgi:mRNA interferase MazF
VFGDVLIARFPFNNGTNSKIRPVLVLFELNTHSLICRITSANYSGDNDVSIADWAAAGLLKPSVAHLDRLVTVDSVLLRRKLGRLTDSVQQSKRAVWKNRQMKL